jgi:hypothetical protein
MESVTSPRRCPQCRQPLLRWSPQTFVCIDCTTFALPTPAPIDTDADALPDPAWVDGDDYASECS